MRKDLMQTSSIFSEDKEKKVPILYEEEQTFSEETLEDYNTGSFQRCRVITHDLDKPDDTISLVKLFPDSKVCILYNPYHESYFLGNIPEEHLYDIPFTTYDILLTTTEMVLLKIKRLDQDEPTHIMVSEGKYTLMDDVDFEVEDEKFVNLKGKQYTMESSEIEKAKSMDEGNIVLLTFEGYQIKIYKDKTLVFIDTKHNNEKLLLADQYGFYFGFYLKLNSDNTVNLGGRKFVSAGRPTLTLAKMIEVQTEEECLVTCKKQMLLYQADFMEEEADELEVVNGVALLFEEQNGTSVLNVFTPNHQRILLEPKYKVDTKSIGNGLYFRKDGVVLLDNGTLTFVEKGTKRNQINIKGRLVDLPIRYLGDI